MNILDIFCYIPPRFKFVVWAPWGWTRLAETYRISETPYFQMCL